MAGKDRPKTGLGALVRESQRRRVDRLVALYAASCFGVAYGIDLLVDALSLPSVLLRVAVLTLLGAFPLAVLVGWRYDRTPNGWIRTPAAPDLFRWSPTAVFLATAVIASGPASVAWLGEVLPSGSDGSTAPVNIIDDRVAVLPFENLTGDESLNSVGLIAADWLIDGLSRMPYLKIVDAQTAIAGWSPAVEEAARELSAAIVVTGRYQAQGDSLSIVARVVNSDGSVLAAIPAVSAPRSNPVLALDPLRERVQVALGAVLDPTIANFEIAPGAPPTFPAYQSYMEGLQSYLNGGFIAAGDHFSFATKNDPSFDRAWVWMAQSDAAMRYSERFDTATAWLTDRRTMLSAYDQNRFDFAVSLFDRNYDGMYLAARGMLLAAPGSDDVRREGALAAMRTRRHIDAAALLMDLDPNRGLIRFWDDYWVEIAWALLRAGDPETALEYAEMGLDHRGPNDLQALAALALTHAYEGRANETLDAARRIFRAGDAQTKNGIKLLISVSSLLTTSGHPEAGEQVLTELLDRLERAEGGGSNASVARRLELYMRADRLADARALRDSVAASISLDRLPVLGVIAAAEGNRAEAEDWLGKLPGPNGIGAMISAKLGDAEGVVLNIAQTPDDPHTGIVGNRDPIFELFWDRPDFIAATRVRN